MRPREFTINNLITYPFSQSRVTEISMVLRSVDLFPFGNKHDFDTHVSVNEAALFLYLLASDTPVKYVRENIEMLLKLENDKGELFFNDFSDILRNPNRLKKIQNVEVGSVLRFACINYRDGKSVMYTNGDVSKLVQHVVRLPYTFLAFFCRGIYSDELDIMVDDSLENLLDNSFETVRKEIIDPKKCDAKKLAYTVKNWDDIRE